jgi:hypothetical protein
MDPQLLNEPELANIWRDVQFLEVYAPVQNHLVEASGMHKPFKHTQTIVQRTHNQCACGLTPDRKHTIPCVMQCVVPCE